MDGIISIIPYLACGFVIGFLIAYSGVGGGALVIPVFVTLFDLSPALAVGTASVYATITKATAGFGHWRSHNINQRLCMTFSVVAIPGVLISAIGVNFLLQHFEKQPQALETMQTTLVYLIALAIALSLIIAQYRPTGTKKISPAWLAIAAFIVGLVMGLTGVGGGVLIVPSLLLLTDEPPKRVVGNSIVIALVLSLLTAIIYTGGGKADYELALWMSVGSFLSIKPAMLLLQKSSEKTVRYALNVLIVIALVLMLTGQ